MLSDVHRGAMCCWSRPKPISQRCARRARRRLQNPASGLDELADHLGANKARAPWAVHFYQLANRLAHLHFLRRHDVPAWLILVGFLGDRDMKGPSSIEAWEAAYDVAFHVMGIPRKHALSPYIVHVHPAVPDVPQ